MDEGGDEHKIILHNNHENLTDERKEQLLLQRDRANSDFINQHNEHPFFQKTAMTALEREEEKLFFQKTEVANFHEEHEQLLLQEVGRGDSDEQKEKFLFHMTTGNVNADEQKGQLLYRSENGDTDECKEQLLIQTTGNADSDERKEQLLFRKKGTADSALALSTVEDDTDINVIEQEKERIERSVRRSDLEGSGSVFLEEQRDGIVNIKEELAQKVESALNRTTSVERSFIPAKESFSLDQTALDTVVRRYRVGCSMFFGVFTLTPRPPTVSTS